MIFGAADSVFYYEADVKPAFHGDSENTFPIWVYENIKYPEVALKTKTRATVMVMFTITEDGSVSDVKAFEPWILKGKPSFTSELRTEAERIVSLSPKWTPGEKDGVKVNTVCFFIIDFYFHGNKNPPSPSEKYTSLYTKDYFTDDICDTKPTFLGNGTSAFSKWVGTKLVYPPISKKNKVEGTVKVQFKVDTTGCIIDAEVTNGVSRELDEEALRVVNSSPRWTPGYLCGKPIKVVYRIPVIFMLLQ